MVFRWNLGGNQTTSRFNSIFREWPPQSVSSLRSTSCARCVRTSSPTRSPYRADTASAYPASAATGGDTSPNTAPTASVCSLAGPTSASTAFWQMCRTTTGRLDHPNHPIRSWYFANLYQIFTGDSVQKWIKLVCLCSLMLLLQVIDVEQMIQERLQKIERVKYSLNLQKVNWKTHIIKKNKAKQFLY